MKKRIALALAVIMTFAALSMTLVADGFTTYRAEDVKIIKSGYREQEVATFTMEEPMIGSWRSDSDMVFILTGPMGDTLDGVKFSKISVDSANTNLGKFDCYNDENHNTANGAPAADHVYFNENGNAVTLTGIAVNAGKKGKMVITFELSTDINFEGDIYVTTIDPNTPPSIKAVDPTVDSGFIKVATVKPTVAVEIESISPPISARGIEVADIIISELDIENRLKKDKNINLFVGQYGNGTPVDFSIVPLKDSNIVVTGDMGIKVDSSTGSSTTLAIDKSSTDGLSKIEVTGVQVDINRSVPYGWYELYVSGNALRDNGKAEFISDGLVSNKTVAGTDRRDYFDNSGIVIDKYINVGGAPPAPSSVKVTIFNNETANVLINGKAAEMEAPTVNIDGSLYVPLRFIAYALGVTENDIVWNDVTKTVAVTLNYRTVIWTQDSPIMLTGSGARAAMSNGATARIINNRMYIPFRGFAEAFNIPAVWDEESQSATYNPHF